MIHVMIVDDEPVSQNYIRGLIPWEEEGYKLHPPVYNGEEAKKILNSLPVNIVFLDVFMPGENGVMLSRYIAERHPGIAMVAISSHDDYDYVREIMKNGALDYILKHRLNEVSLRSALRLIAIREKEPLNPDREKEKRERVRAWLFSGGPCPFPPGSGRIIVSAAKVPLDSLPPESRNVVVMGIISLMENEGEGYITAHYREPDFFVLCIHFANIVSERQTLDLLAQQNQKNRDNIQLIYKLEYLFKDLPPLNPAAIPNQIQRFLDFFPKRGESPPGLGITLPVTRRKTIALFLREANRAGIEFVFHEIFALMSEKDQSDRLAIIRDLGEILKDFAEEKGIPANFSGLSGWAQKRSPKECEDKIRELYRQLMDEAQGLTNQDSYISRARNYILNHYTKDINLEKTAAALTISPSYLSRLFKKETGFSFVDTLNSIRVDAAKACILEGMNLKGTAAFCGFMYYNYFTKVFKDHTGITPTEYFRKRYDR